MTPRPRDRQSAPRGTCPSQLTSVDEQATRLSYSALGFSMRVTTALAASASSGSGSTWFANARATSPSVVHGAASIAAARTPGSESASASRSVRLTSCVPPGGHAIPSRRRMRSACSGLVARDHKSTSASTPNPFSRANQASRVDLSEAATYVSPRTSSGTTQRPSSRSLERNHRAKGSSCTNPSKSPPWTRLSNSSSRGRRGTTRQAKPGSSPGRSGGRPSPIPEKDGAPWCVRRRTSSSQRWRSPRIWSRSGPEAASLARSRGPRYSGHNANSAAMTAARRSSRSEDSRADPTASSRPDAGSGADAATPAAAINEAFASPPSASAIRARSSSSFTVRMLDFNTA